MVDLKKLRDQIIEAIDHRNREWLEIERAKTPDNQFTACRRLFLNELGKPGLKADINDLFFKASLASVIEDSEDDLDQLLPV